MQACLREHRALLTWDCQEQLFRQEVENADDLRLSVRLFKSCLADKRKVQPGPESGLCQKLLTEDVSASESRLQQCMLSLPPKLRQKGLIHHRAFKGSCSF